jgi:3D (Asp-Asp-Asp) domain-containing protein
MSKEWISTSVLIALAVATFAAVTAEPQQDRPTVIQETQETTYTPAAVAPDAGVGRQVKSTEAETSEPPLEEIEETEELEETEPQSIGTFKLTAYCACPLCCGEWSDGITYMGTTATAGRTIAVDPTIIPLGSTVYINGEEYIAEDIGGAIKGHRIDIFHPTHIDALEFGVQYAEVLTY